MRYLLTGCLWLLAAVAAAQGSDQREFGVTWSRGAPRVSFSAKDLADEKVRKELKSALRKRIVIRVAAQLGGSGRTIATRQFGCDVTRDLWEDGYLVRIGTRTERLSTLDKALERCLLVEGLFVGEPPKYQAYRGKQIFFSVQAEFNPISDKQCRELIQPSGNDDTVGPITVSIVRRRICQAERTVLFRSQNVQVPQ